ncbi:MAG TPA: tyrosine-type recombinase/integrase [Mycobacteriales bacterium]|nr:tyrosine-type recombinase/integrase [Mycobacteriales bacterium]
MSDDRRRWGESSIGKEKDGRWHGYVSMGTKSGGRRDRRHVAGRTRADVAAKVRELEKQRDAGITATSGTLTVAAWLDHWLDNIAARRVRPRVLEGYRATVRLHITPTIGHHRLARLQPEHVEELHAAMFAKGLSPATVLRAHRVLARALRVAEQRGRVARNVATLVDAPAAGRPATGGALTVEEIRKVLTAALDRRNGARWAIALGVGLRQSEVLALRWTDLDLDTGTLSVNRTVQRVAGVGLTYDEPKSDRSRRRIALPAPLVDALRAHRAAQHTERLKAGTSWEDHGLVFAQPNGRPIDKRADWREWRTLLTEAGVRTVRLHDARHSAATTLLALGVDVRIVADMLGHSQTRVTSDTYQHVLPAMAHDAADRIGTALWGN